MNEFGGTKVKIVEPHQIPIVAPPYGVCSAEDNRRQV